jgi:inosose dehydratase
LGHLTLPELIAPACLSKVTFTFRIRCKLWYYTRHGLDNALIEEMTFMESVHSRRELLQVATVGTAAIVAGRSSATARAAGGGAPAKTRTPKFELGLASYTLRKFDLDKTLQITTKVGLKHIAFKDVHLPLNSSPAQIQETVAKVKEAGLDLYGGGVIYMGDEAQVNRAFEYAKAAGMRVIIGVPQKPELLPLLDKKVKEYDIKVAIHNHGPGDKLFPVPASVYEKVKDLDPRIGLCNDVGHTIRAGVDPAVSVEQFPDRLLDVHIKDESAAAANGRPVEVGRGVIDIPRVLNALIKINYAGMVSFEYEKDENDPVAGLAESVGYVRGVLKVLST